MKGLPLLLPVLLCLHASAGTASTSASTTDCHQVAYAGRAYDLDSGDLLYVEEHRETRCDDRHTHSQVVYRSAAGDTLITKQVDFSRFPALPDMRFEDRRTGYVEAATVEGDSLVLQRRQAADAELERRALRVNKPAVVDAGFDHAVRQAWDRLAAGEDLQVDFAVPNKLTDYRFRIRRRGEGPLDGVLRLRIEPANFFLRLIAPHIDLAYNADSRRLRTYEGITNVPSESGRRYRARVEFSYPADTATAGL